MELHKQFCQHYGISDKPFSRLPSFIIRKFEEEWKTTDLEGFFYQYDIVRGIVTSPPSSVRKCMQFEHYFYLYGAVWGLNLREVKEVSLISLMHIYESIIGRRYFGKCALKEKFIVTDITTFGSMVELVPEERYFLTEKIIEARLCALKRDIEDTVPLNQFTTFLSHPLHAIILAAVGIETKIALAKLFKEKRQSAVFEELYAMQTLEEVMEKYKVKLPHGVTPFIYVRDNILDLMQKPYTADMVETEGYLPAFRSARELRRIYRDKKPCYFVRDKKFVCGYEAPTTANKLTAHYLGVNVETRVKAAHDAQVNLLRGHFTLKTPALQQYVHALYRFCVDARGGGTICDESVFFVSDSDELDFYYKKLNEEERTLIDTFPFLTSFFTQESVSHRNRLRRKDMTRTFYTCCVMMLLLDLECPIDPCKIEYIF
jgi:hypothetical protein